MKKVIDTSEILGTVDTAQGICEVCASAVANYDDVESRLEVRLETFLRPANIRTKEKHLPAKWLPKGEIIAETVGPDETVDAARSIFQSWVRKVRAAAPALHSATF